MACLGVSLTKVIPGIPRVHVATYCLRDYESVSLMSASNRIPVVDLSDILSVLRTWAAALR